MQVVILSYDPKEKSTRMGAFFFGLPLLPGLKPSRSGMQKETIALAKPYALWNRTVFPYLHFIPDIARISY